MTRPTPILAFAALLLAAAPLAAQSSPDAASSRLEGFEARRERGNGRFVTREEVEQAHPARLTDLLRGVPGVRMVIDEDGKEQVRLGTRTGNRQSAAPTSPRGTSGSGGRGGATTPGGDPGATNAGTRPTVGALRDQGNAAPGDCPVVYYLDGIYFPLSRGESINDAVPARAVEGVEIYQRAGQVPSQFVRQGSDCGVIVIWTRKG
ncbi:MAG TPA: hypothetical protein VFQ39_05405 [Longimicrobium sp.]|nr:hypothetical protein [Longimicrobium sp.]